MVRPEKLYFSPVGSLVLPFANKDKLIQIFNQHSEPIQKAKSDNKQNFKYNFWNGITCYKSKLYQPENLLYPGPDIDCAHLLRTEIDLLESGLPVEIETISLWRNDMVVPPHKDAEVYNHQDYDFRFRFFLEVGQPSFFIQAKGVKKIIKLPENKNVFFFNNRDCFHGSEYFPDSTKILGVIRGRIKKEPFVKFLETEYALTREFSLSEDDF